VGLSPVPCHFDHCQNMFTSKIAFWMKFQYNYVSVITGWLNKIRLLITRKY